MSGSSGSEGISSSPSSLGELEVSGSSGSEVLLSSTASPGAVSSRSGRRGRKIAVGASSDRSQLRAAVRASRMATAEGNRWAGSRAKALSTSSSISIGRLDRKAVGGLMGSFQICHSSSLRLSALKGRSAVSIS